MLNRKLAATSRSYAIYLVTGLIILLAAGIAGCGGNGDHPADSGAGANPSPPSTQTAFKARFDPQGGVLPFPNDLYFDGSTDGTLNIPVGKMDNPGDSLTAINTLDGYSTLAPIDASFSTSVDPATLVGGRTVFLFNVTVDSDTKAVSGVQSALTAGKDYKLGLSSAEDAGQSIVTIRPLHPLKSASAYLVVLTNGIEDTAGNAASPDTDYADIKQAELPVLTGGDEGKLADPSLKSVAKFTLAQLKAAAGAGIDPHSIVLTFSFSTQSEGAVLNTIETHAESSAGILASTDLTTRDVVPGKAGQGLADILAGNITLPYYLSKPSTAHPQAPLTDFWHGQDGTYLTRSNPKPVATGNVTVPALASVPDPQASDCTMPAAGWPIVIFQHGFTRNREDMFAIADAFAQACFAVIAIDQPLHGITDTSDPFYRNQLFTGTPAAALMTGERTFDLDVQNNATGAAGADGKIDASGANYINLKSLLTSRDNLRESAADLIHLTQTIPAITADGKAIFDGSRIYFAGHSLGSIVGTTYLGIDPTAVSATLANPGGDIAQSLQQSPTLAPQIKSGLEAQGIVQGTQAYAEFFRNVQTVIDSGDPANYAAAAAAKHPIHMLEIVGGAGSPPDQVIPNASTNLLAQIMGLASITQTATDPGGVHGIVRFTAGDHSSLLDPSADSAVTTEMQTEMVKFAASNGTKIVIANPSVIKQKVSISVPEMLGLRGGPQRGN